MVIEEIRIGDEVVARKEVDLTAIITYLNVIRVTMDTDLRKAKQKLTNLVQNLINKKGKCFKIVRE